MAGLPEEVKLGLRHHSCCDENGDVGWIWDPLLSLGAERCVPANWGGWHGADPSFLQVPSRVCAPTSLPQRHGPSHDGQAKEDPKPLWSLQPQVWVGS